MPNPLGSTGFTVADNTQIGAVRRFALTLSNDVGLSEEGRSNFAIIATEAATNLVRHAGGGEIVFRQLSEPAGVELLALDKGPGMANPTRCMEDGYSTAGGPGNGLGAIRRLSHRFDLYSQPDSGTVLMSQVCVNGRPARKPLLDYGAINLPLHGQSECGDGFAVSQRPDRAVFMIADGLGHGPLAAEGSRGAVRVFQQEQHRPFDLNGFIHRSHDALRKTRGAALAVAEVDPAGKLVRFTGAGNIAGTIVRNDVHRYMVSHNGTVGAEVRKVQEFQYPWDQGDLLVMYSDGLGTSWHLDAYPGLASRHPAIIAAVLYRDFRRTRDDVTVLVAKEPA